VYTRCPGCHTTHALSAGLLAQGGGRYRCGKCQKVCNALDALFDEYPDAGDKPPTTGDLPVLGVKLDLEEARQSRLDPEHASLVGERQEPAGEPRRARSGLARLVWIAGAAVVAIAVAFEWSDFQQKPLLEQPAVQSWMIRLGIREPSPDPIFRDLEQIVLVSRELKTHPLREDMLRLTATIVNRAAKTQPYPELEVLLLDSRGVEISRKLFTPEDYLAENSSTISGMTPQAYLPLILDLPDPGREAVGFELNFR
jgi:predicted Zn finger-like uncharacterized protein